MSVEEECELQQLVSSDEENVKDGCLTPPQSVRPVPVSYKPTSHIRTHSDLSHKTSKV